MSDPPQHPAILAGDSDRDRSVELLTTAVAEGRLTLEEFSDRVGLVHAARTQDQLAALTGDLPAGAPEPGALAPQPERHTAFCSQLVRRGPWELATRTSFRSVCGTITLDLTEARLSGADSEMEIANFFGTVHIIVPEEVQVSVSGGGAFASQVIDPPSPTAAGAPRLRIRTRGPGGTLHVRKPGARTNPMARVLGIGGDS